MENMKLDDITLFCEVYCKFLNKITDDMYLELTYQDTIKMLKSMLVSAIVNFRFPKINIRDYYLASPNCISCTEQAYTEIEGKTLEEGFDEYCDCAQYLDIEGDLTKLDHWNIKLGIDEIEILAVLMKIDWLGQQLDSVDMLQMKILPSDFDIPSQANHIAKLTDWFKESVIQLESLQGLYNRRIVDDIGNVTPNYKQLGGKNRNGYKRPVRL